MPSPKSMLTTSLICIATMAVVNRVDALQEFVEG